MMMPSVSGDAIVYVNLSNKDNLNQKIDILWFRIFIFPVVPIYSYTLLFINIYLFIINYNYN